MGRNDLTTRGQITLVLDKEVINYIRERSKKTDVPISRFIERLVREVMECDDSYRPSTTAELDSQ